MWVDANNSSKLLPSALCALAGFGASWAVIRCILKAVKRGAVGGNRSFHHTHNEPIPRFGGVALAAAFALIVGVIAAFTGLSSEGASQHIVITLGALAIFALGFWDDLKPLGAKKKLAAQLVIAASLYLAGLQISHFRVPGFTETYALGGWTSAVATIGWLVAIPNLVNLIDGTDGLAGGVSLMLMCLLSYVAWNGQGDFGALTAIGMSGALLGFLRFNFPPAKIYMGDGGAYLLGFLIAALSLESSHKGTVAAALTAPLLALALPIIDMSFAIVRRWLAGLPLFRPDQQHIHHRLRKSGLSRTKTVLTLYAVSLVFLFIAFAAFLSQGKLVPMLLGILLLFVVVGARSFGLIKDWAAIGRTLGRSRETRQETQYALTLLRWIELEAGRRPSLDELWADFGFVCRKLGFSEVRAAFRGEEKVARLGEARAPRRSAHELHLGEVMTVEFEADAEGMDEDLFDLLSELSAEAWLKAIRAWQTAHSASFSFEPTADRAGRAALGGGFAVIRQRKVAAAPTSS